MSQEHKFLGISQGFTTSCTVVMNARLQMLQEKIYSRDVVFDLNIEM